MRNYELTCEEHPGGARQTLPFRSIGEVYRQAALEMKCQLWEDIGVFYTEGGYIYCMWFRFLHEDVPPVERKWKAMKIGRRMQ